MMEDSDVLSLIELQNDPQAQASAEAEIVQRDDIVSKVYAFSELSDSEEDLFDYTTNILDGFDALVEDFMDILSLSPSALALWDRASYHGYHFAFAPLGNEGYEISHQDQTLYLDIFSLKLSALLKSEHYRDAILLNLVRGLREIHHDIHMGDIARLYRVEDLLKIERARVADIEAMTAQIAWELRASEEDHIWRNLIGQEDGDIAIAFWQALEDRPSALFDGRALARGFKQWYTDQHRSDVCDRDMLDFMDDILRDVKSYNPFGTHKISGSVFESLFTTPQGRRYLHGWGDTILHDPFYAGMHDAYNQAHLFQLMQDIDVTIIGEVPFKDATLAHRIFPQDDSLL